MPDGLVGIFFFLSKELLDSSVSAEWEQKILFNQFMDGCSGQVSYGDLGNSSVGNKTKARALSCPFQPPALPLQISLFFYFTERLHVTSLGGSAKGISIGEPHYTFTEQILATDFTFLRLQTCENELTHDFPECGLKRKLLELRCWLCCSSLCKASLSKLEVAVNFIQERRVLVLLSWIRCGSADLF